MTTVSPPRGPRPPQPPDSRPPFEPRYGPQPGPRPAKRAPAPPVLVLPALIGAFAVLAGTLAIPPMISGGSWFWPAAEVVMVIWLVGIGARLARIPAAAAMGLQLVAVLIALTALFTVRGYGGVIPNAAVFDEATDLLAGAWNQIRSNVSPAPVSPELSFLICLTVATTALIVDWLVTVGRTPALVALPLLCMYAVPASIDVTALTWAAFVVPALLYALLLIADGLEGRRMGSAEGAVEVGSGLVVAALAAVVALVVASSVTGIGTSGRLPRTNTGPSTGIGLSPFTSLEGNLQRGDPVDLLRVSGLPGPAYLRTVGLQLWTPGEGWSVDQLAEGALPDRPLAVGQTQVDITPLAYRDQFLPIYEGVAWIDGVDAGWSFDSALESVHRPDPVDPGRYQMRVNFDRPTADQLRADSTPTAEDLLATGELRPEVVATAAAVVGDAATAFDKADRLRSWFTDPANGFTYSLEVPAGNSGDRLVDFLELKQGYCEQYASAMAVMLRAVGVPARVAVGFTQGTRAANGDYVINSHDAHAWVEVPFTGAGWVAFDPTPLGGGQGGQQGYASASAAPTTAPTGPTAAGSGLAPDGQEPDGGVPSVAPATSTEAAGALTGNAPVITVPPAVWWALGVLVVLAALIAGPTVVRRRRRDRRLSVADAGGPDAAAAAWREIEDLAVDHGVALDPAQSARACANRLAKVAQLPESGRRQLRELVATAESGWYGGHHATGAPDSVGDRAGGSVAPGATLVQAVPVEGVPVEAVPVQAATVAVASTPPGASLGDAPRTLAVELAHQVPLSWLDRLVPRSVRPRWWRD